ncbi:YcgL domain-containing protein [Gallaecimonas mangrovi]|uniref:YcgL domain-containing protein n=1 Tax=Gallaecimonas mangrovi TaxID=2291597 RepID=UPI000E202451|nr:YcgL domain-containing protein [Gallaecimonas mangrovi]
MLCAVYKSAKKVDTYLYVPGKGDFSQVPAELLEMFGAPVFVTQLLLNSERKLARMTADQMKAHLEEKGFYLQLPPPQEDLLKTFRASQGDS